MTTIIENIKKIAPVAAAVLLVMLLIAAIADPTFSWLAALRGKELVSLTGVETPVMIEIGTSENGEFEPFDMGKIDVEDPSGYKEYVFCVYSEKGSGIIYDLYLAHTTNIGFRYSLFPAIVVGSPAGADITYLGQSYTKGSEITGSYLNETGSDGLAKTDDQYYVRTYGTYDTVQKYGVPLYWKTDSHLSLDTTITVDGKEYDCRYYILRVSWDTDVLKLNRKETDMFYIMAQSV